VSIEILLNRKVGCMHAYCRHLGSVRFSYSQS
jgi:hypothetical protein